MLAVAVRIWSKVDSRAPSVQGWQRTTAHGTVVVAPSVLLQYPRMGGLADVLQNAAKARSYLVVAADRLHILPTVANVEVTYREVDKHRLIAGSSVEPSERTLILCRPRVIYGHELA